jgi:hypothetical protein
VIRFGTLFEFLACTLCDIVVACMSVQVTRIHGVNGWEIASHFSSRKFDLICWNHPHLGVEDFRLHQFLMAHFFHSAKSALKETGEVCVSLVSGQVVCKERFAERCSRYQVNFFFSFL